MKPEISLEKPSIPVTRAPGILASQIFIVRPALFSYNPETATSNKFQQKLNLPPEEVHIRALSEFDRFAVILREHGIDVACLSDTLHPRTPDSIFPNNWVSFHAGGKAILYPMHARNRRLETRKGFLGGLVDGFGLEISTLMDLRYYVEQNKYLEGTGSMELDRVERLAWMCLSERSHPDPLEEVCAFLGYRAVTFRAFDADGYPIYHTDVVMSIGKEYAVICEEAVHEEDRDRVMNTLRARGGVVISIRQGQMAAFAGNIIQVLNRAGEKLILMSESAYHAFDRDQLELLGQESRLVPIPVPTIETVGGGSVRCMITEVF